MKQLRNALLAVMFGLSSALGISTLAHAEIPEDAIVVDCQPIFDQSGAVVAYNVTYIDGRGFLAIETCPTCPI